MSERKVLNKYYPPDFDPSKIPRMKLPKNRQYTVRLMAPFNMRCATCGEYIYKGKKFNARKEDVENEDYLGIRIYRFYIKCTRCLQEISFKTDPKSTDYEIEAGATRNFMALKLAEEQALREEEEAKEEEASNPMKLLENRTQQSKNEIELLESLEDLKDLNKRQQTVDYDTMLLQFNNKLTEREREEKLKELDEEYIKTIKFQPNLSKRKIIVEEEIIEDLDAKVQKQSKPLQVPIIADSIKALPKRKTFASTTKKNILNNLVKLPSSKRNVENIVTSTNDSVESTTSNKGEKSSYTNKDIEAISTNNVEEPTSTSRIEKPVNGLQLLGNYSDSESE